MINTLFTMSMEIKSNHSTGNRPEGDRILDAPYVFSDIPTYLEQLKSEKSWAKNDRNAITVYKSDKITIVIAILLATGVTLEVPQNATVDTNA